MVSSSLVLVSDCKSIIVVVVVFSFNWSSSDSSSPSLAEVGTSADVGCSSFSTEIRTLAEKVFFLNADASVPSTFFLYARGTLGPIFFPEMGSSEFFRAVNLL